MHRITIVVFLGIVANCCSGDDATPQMIIESRETHRIIGILRYTTQHPKLQAVQWAAFVPSAPELSRQSTVSSVTFPEGKVEKELGPAGRKLIFISVAARKENEQELKLSLTVEATLHPRSLRQLNPGEKPPSIEQLTENDRKIYLRESGPLDFNSNRFRTWLKEKKLLRREGESELDFGRRAFQWIKAHGKYDYRVEMERRASRVCEDVESDCGGLSILWVSILRANQLPARVLFGRWAESSHEAEQLKGIPYYQVHVKAEFYVRNIGWIPVDLASAISHDPKREGLMFFGQDQGDFLTLHIDPQFDVNSRLYGKDHFSWLQSPKWWVRGGGELTPCTETESWEVRLRK